MIEARTEALCQALAARMRGASRISVMTGAGISAASGVPTFRGAGGLWRDHRATDLATPEAFRADPELVWEFYAWRRELVAECQPNAGHEVLAAWSREFEHFQLITQNVDGLHEAAGTDKLTRLHGSLWQMSCWQACAASPPSWPDRRVPLPELPPRCPHCDGLARPGVVWFGEALAAHDLDAASRASCCDLFLTIGTSAVVHPAAGLVDAAQRNGAFTVEINPDGTPATSRVDLAIHLPAEEALVRVAEIRRASVQDRGRAP